MKRKKREVFVVGGKSQTNPNIFVLAPGFVVALVVAAEGMNVHQLRSTDIAAEPQQSALERSTKHGFSNTVDGQNPAPPKKPWNDDSSVNTHKQWFLMVSKWCRISSIHSMGMWVCTSHLPKGSRNTRLNRITTLTEYGPNQNPIRLLGYPLVRLPLSENQRKDHPNHDNFMATLDPVKFSRWTGLRRTKPALASVGNEHKSFQTTCSPVASANMIGFYPLLQ